MNPDTRNDGQDESVQSTLPAFGEEDEPKRHRDQVRTVVERGRRAIGEPGALRPFLLGVVLTACCSLLAGLPKVLAVLFAMSLRRAVHDVYCERPRPRRRTGRPLGR